MAGGVVPSCKKKLLRTRRGKNWAGSCLW